MGEPDPKVIKRTQESLGKFVKKPPLTEKLLKKPPFRFLHDVIHAVIRETGFLDGLFTEHELDSNNVKDKDSKVAFLEKVINAVLMVTGEPLAVKPSKVVAGHEPEKTNEFLQAIAKALNNNMDSTTAVQRVLAGEKPPKVGHKKATGEKKKAEEKKSEDGIKKAPAKEEKGKRGTDTGKGKGTSVTEKKRTTTRSKENAQSSRVEGKDARPRASVGGRGKRSPLKEASQDRPVPVLIGNLEDHMAEGVHTLQNGEEDGFAFQGAAAEQDFLHGSMPESHAVENGVNIEHEALEPQPPLEMQNSPETMKPNYGFFDESETSTVLVLPSLDTSLHDIVRYPMDIVTNTVINTLIGNTGEPDLEHEVTMKESEPENAGPSPMNQEPRPSTSREPIDDGFFGGRSSRLDSHLDLHADQGMSLDIGRSSPVMDSGIASKSSSAESMGYGMEREQGLSPPGQYSPAASPRPGTSAASGSPLPTAAALPEHSFARPTTGMSRPVTGKGRPMTSGGRRTARPPSARPAPPRIREKSAISRSGDEENIGGEIHRPQTGKVANVILDTNKSGASAMDDDDDAFVVQETPAPDDLLERTQELEGIEDGQHGVLVSEILHAKSELEAPTNDKAHIEIERDEYSDTNRRREREMVMKEVTGLRASIQNLTRQANPLGKLMDFIQEDLDSMTRELKQWTDEYQRLSLDLNREQATTEGSLEPLRGFLAELEQGIEDQLDKIGAVKSKILRNEERIHKMLQGISSTK
ncbi:unnamed protein product [Darwinula stevensoni]|uniref:TRAF3-interacting protein 1 n=1 Tax=Darwinula stevensoni TaxID=69355 RepID=A0A7R9A711_9CRUS|nr:unnamed protein product [Darwinula stevensoni]CAG0889732.1 unnamed protein product [Darwinula stevensoni]